MGRSLPEKVAGSQARSPLFEIAFVLVRFDHVASSHVNADHSIVWTAVMLCVADCIRDGIRFAVPQPTEW